MSPTRTKTPAPSKKRAGSTSAPSRRTAATRPGASNRAAKARGGTDYRLKAVAGTKKMKTGGTTATRVSDEAVRAKTGKGWKEWFAVLDSAGAKTWKHAEIAKHLHDSEGCPAWWSQMVTVGYEQARGLRSVHEHTDGYSATKSMTFETPVGKLFDAWNNAKLRARWLDEPEIEIRTATRPKSMRIVWSDGSSRVNVGFFSKGAGRSTAQLEHNRLTDRQAVERVKHYWEEKLGRLKKLLEG